MCRCSNFGMVITDLLNSSRLSYGPKSVYNFNSRLKRSGRLMLIKEYCQLAASIGKMVYETIVSERLMYFINGHLRVRSTRCSFLIRSLAKLIAVTVGDMRVHIWCTESSESPDPHNTMSVKWVHLVIIIDMLLALSGLYLPSNADSASLFPPRNLGDLFRILDRLIAVNLSV